jgi:hypothetical protein
MKKLDYTSIFFLLIKDAYPILHGEQEKFLPFCPISSYFYVVILNFFSNKLCYHFHYKKKKVFIRITYVPFPNDTYPVSSVEILSQ